MFIGNLALGSDPISLRMKRLASYAPASGVSALLASDDIEGVGEVAAFLHSWMFRSYANGPRVRKLLMGVVIPGYQDGATRVQRLLRNPEYPPPDSSEIREPGLSRLRRFLNHVAD